MIFTSQLPDIRFSLDESIDYVNLRVEVNHAPVFFEVVYNRGDSTGLENLSSLVEDYMRIHKLVLAHVDISATRGASDNVVMYSQSYDVCFCDRYAFQADAEKLLRENFLLANSSPRIAPMQDFSCKFVAFDAEDISVKVNLILRSRNRPQELVPHSFVLNEGFIQQNDEVLVVSLRYHEIMSHIPNSENYYLAQFSIAVGNRSVSVAVDPQLKTDRDAFRFRNCYNVFEDITIPASTTLAPEISSEVAIVNGQAVSYDHKNIQTYEVETAYLTHGEFDAVRQLCCSREVEKYVITYPDGEQELFAAPIVVTETEFKFRLDGDEPPTAKFSWRFKSPREVFKTSFSPNIHTDQFNINFN